eukprot:3518651-Pleurochrysis_carterae.AAC.1
MQGTVDAPGSGRSRASATGNTSLLSPQNQQQSMNLGGEQQATDPRGRHNNRTEHAREGHGHGVRVEDPTTLPTTDSENGRSSIEMTAQPTDDAKPGGHRNNRTAHAGVWPRAHLCSLVMESTTVLYDESAVASSGCSTHADSFYAFHPYHHSGNHALLLSTPKASFTRFIPPARSPKKHFLCSHPPLSSQHFLCFRTP